MLGDTISIVWLLGSLTSVVFIVRPVNSWPPVSHRWRAAIWLLVFFSLPFDWSVVDPAGRQAWADAVEARHRAPTSPLVATALPAAASSDACPAPDPGDAYMHQHFPGFLSKHEECILEREAASQEQARQWQKAHPVADLPPADNAAGD